MRSSVGSVETEVLKDSEQTKKTSNEDTHKEGKQATVLETHGYRLGKPVATSEKHKGCVAIKIVRKYSAPQDFLAKFLPREIEIIKKLHHPNLIRFLQAIETTHRVYIIQELAEKGNVLEAIKQRGYIEENRARLWFRQLCEVIHYIHSRGVVHRDIKCENMLLDRNFNIKLTDFGFAKEHPGETAGSISLSETYCGSYAYASPEILLGIPYQPEFADVWSMGVVLFGMVYGRLPYDDTVHKKLLQQVMGRVTFPVYPQVSTKCKILIAKMLSPLRNRILVRDMRYDAWIRQTDEPKPWIEIDKENTTDEESEMISRMSGTQQAVLSKKVETRTEKDVKTVRTDSKENPAHVVVVDNRTDSKTKEKTIKNPKKTDSRVNKDKPTLSPSRTQPATKMQHT